MTDSEQQGRARKRTDRHKAAGRPAPVHLILDLKAQFSWELEIGKGYHISEIIATR